MPVERLHVVDAGKLRILATVCASDFESTAEDRDMSSSIMDSFVKKMQFPSWSMSVCSSCSLLPLSGTRLSGRAWKARIQTYAFATLWKVGDLPAPTVAPMNLCVRRARDTRGGPNCGWRHERNSRSWGKQSRATHMKSVSGRVSVLFIDARIWGNMADATAREA